MLRRDPAFQVVGLLDSNPGSWRTEVCGVAVLGGDEMLAELRRQGIDAAFIGVGSTASTARRIELYTRARGHGFDVISIVDTRAIVSPYATVGAGATIMPAAVVNAGATLGEDVIVNTGAIVEHDCAIDDHVHVATGARLAGGVCVGRGAHIGLGASVRQQVRIGCHAIVGAAALVIDDVPDRTLVMGVPARVVRETSNA